MPWLWIDPDKALLWVAERLKLTFADSQTTAIRQTLACKELVITGCPASAKPPSSRTTASPRRGKSLTPTSRSNQGHPSDQGLLTSSQKCVTHVFERAKYARSNSAVANCNLFLVFVSHHKGAPHAWSPCFLSVIRFI
jgi:hypothetical protein